MATSSRDTPILDGLKLMASGLATMFVAALVVSLIFGGPLLTGIFGGLDLAAAVFIAIIALYYLTYRSGQVSFPFVLSAVAILVVLGELAPVWVTAALPNVGQFIGVNFSQLDPFQFTVLAIVTIIAYWALTIRLTGRAKKADTVAKRVSTKAEQLVDTYVTIGRVAAAFVVTAGLMVLREGGQFAGDIGGILAEAPVVTSNIVSVVAGYLSLGGSIPILEDIPLLSTLSAGEFGVLALALLAVAAAVREQ